MQKRKKGAKSKVHEHIFFAQIPYSIFCHLTISACKAKANASKLLYPICLIFVGWAGCRLVFYDADAYWMLLSSTLVVTRPPPQR